MTAVAVKARDAAAVATEHDMAMDVAATKDDIVVDVEVGNAVVEVYILTGKEVTGATEETLLVVLPCVW